MLTGQVSRGMEAYQKNEIKESVSQFGLLRAALKKNDHAVKLVRLAVQ